MYILENTPPPQDWVMLAIGLWGKNINKRGRETEENVRATGRERKTK
jgi:hypothetical protein